MDTLQTVQLLHQGSHFLGGLYACKIQCSGMEFRKVEKLEVHAVNGTKQILSQLISLRLYFSEVRKY